ncbi:MAG: ATP-binding cassette domain-containing protein, partial [Planctomycetota bacterium]|nr:ATP-binding cassette domain-containing protein [Planctomycetota bacterium]
MIEVRDLQKSFPVKETLFKALITAFTGKQRFVRAVNGVSFTMQEGEIFGLAGESGCGKTTTCMLLLRLYTPSGGTIEFQGKDLKSLKGAELSEFRRKAQLIFQDPYESLNPRFTVLRTIEEPLIVNKVRGKAQRRDRVLLAMARSRLTPV